MLYVKYILIKNKQTNKISQTKLLGFIHLIVLPHITLPSTILGLYLSWLTYTPMTGTPLRKSCDRQTGLSTENFGILCC